MKKTKLTLRRAADNLFTYLALIVMSVIFLFPCLWLILASLSKTGSLYDFKGFFPQEYSFQTFIDLFTDDVNRLYPYKTWFFNTLYVAACSALFGTVLVLLTGYVMSRFRFQGRNTIKKTTLVLGMFPGFMGMTAIYIIMTQLGLINKLESLIFYYSATAPLGYMVQKSDLLTYITRLWPILLLIILGIFVAALRLLFLSSQKVEPVRPLLTLPPPHQPPTEKDLQSAAYTIVQCRITQILSAKFPEARWVWENPRAMEDILAGNPTYVLLNRAGGYRRGRVVMQQFQVVDIVFDEKQPTPTPSTPVPAPDPDPARNPAPPALVPEDDEEPMPENFGPLAFNWVESHVIDLNEQCNEAVAEGLSEYLIPAQELPVTESWDAICEALIHSDFRGAHCCDEGIIIEIEQ